jgi:hypothetical protein
MLTKKLVAIILAGLLISSAFILNAQDDSIEQMMKNNQKRNQVMDYMINHHNVMQEFMNKMMNNQDAWNMMDQMFSRANTDSSFYNQMWQYMHNHNNMMSMMQHMMGNYMHGGMMNHHNMMDDSN